MGLGFVPEDLASPSVTKGELKRVLDSWCAPFPWLDLDYASRRQASPALVNARSGTGEERAITAGQVV
jgi:hypothetical protein